MLDDLRHRFAYWWAHQHTVFELRHLDHKGLADIGLDRASLGEIKRRAKAATREACL